ncbi:MAG: DUF4178 domain-containing protein, partial [Planctomycetes bacterium]|nr:DUF4178 domain-containing protein [Planctomycetota bacterium]
MVCASCQGSFILDGEAAALHGEMAVLADTPGPLFVGGSGEVAGHEFRVLGRVRYGYERGFWDEWYLEASDGASFWIGEDERQFTLTRRLALDETLPAWDELEPGATLRVRGHPYHVDERDLARCEGGEGQLPFVIAAGEKVPFVDLSGEGRFLTLEYEGEGPPRVFEGRRIPYTAVRMDYDASGAVASPALAAERAASEGSRRRVVKTSGRELAINCESCGAPQTSKLEGQDDLVCEFCGLTIDLSLERRPCGDCGATVALHSIDAASASCPQCGALHEVLPEKLQLLSQLNEKPKRAGPFRIGMVARLRGEIWRIVGYLRTFMRDEGIKYHTHAYLLFCDRQGYAWLEIDAGHASFFREIDERPKGLNPKTMRRTQTFQF